MAPNVRNAYLDNSVTTASPARLLIMLCERLCLDINRAVEALTSGQPQVAHENLLHAQDIVAELSSSLKPEAFAGGKELSALYTWLHQNLVKANVTKDLKVAAHCAELATGIHDMWREAVLSAVADPTP